MAWWIVSNVRDPYFPVSELPSATVDLVNG